VSAVATFTQKRILVLMSDFALPTDLGSSLISKVMQMESTVINSLVMDHYKKVKSMEKKYAGKNPTLLTADPDYLQYGPIWSMVLSQPHGPSDRSTLILWSNRRNSPCQYPQSYLHRSLWRNPRICAVLL
jgi:hypothetical protein